MSDMKHLVNILLVAALAAGCKQDSDYALQVRGSLANNPEKQAVYLDLVELDGVAPRTLDTVMIEPGQASFTLKAAGERKENIYRLRFQKDNVFVLLISDQPVITFSTNWQDFGNYTVNSPSSASMKELLKTFNGHLSVLDQKRQQVMDARVAGNADSIVAAREADFETEVGKTENFLIGYADTAKNAAVAMYALGLGKSQFDPAKLNNVMLSLARRFADKPEVTRVTTDYFNYMEELAKKDVTGKVAPDFTLPDPDGKLIALSSLRGKYVLVDFWASWCMPCRQENPNVVAAYQNFKGKNFTVFGVSLDKDKASWVKAIKDDKLTWPHVSDLKYWNSSVVPLYNIEGIPFNVLLDPEGKIIASNLRGRALSARLQELLK
jgi:peroxiredoxin